MRRSVGSKSDGAAWFSVRSRCVSGDEYGIGVPYGTLGVSLWVDDQHAGGRLHNAVAGEPDLKYGSTCAKRVDLQVQTRDAPAHPPDLLRRLERLFSGAGAAGRAALE